ncbi:MAG TPA: selenocysteine-specific translation elongation factor, partial [Terriglobales bacterium]|nr:selenocysteine-specific translation elongation factor [Terriglobales bacterium]
VPGHERFVRNMLAGVGGIDLVLLVIAADESLKPQTREHFDICRLLAVRRGITVLTKSDLVDSETLDVVRMEVEDFVKGSFLEKAPVIPVSALEGTGLERLRQELVKAAGEISVKDSTALARLPIDRVFTMKGFGTVVTGTLVAGSIAREQELEVFPGGQRVRVRGVQVHGAQADKAVAGERTALNLASVATDDLVRGMMLAPPDTLRAGSRVDVSLTLLPSAGPLKDRARVHLHAYTWEGIAEVGLYNARQVKPGETAWAQLRLSHPALLLPGDRFILRQFSPVVTMGGGVVIENTPPRRISNRETYSDLLRKVGVSDRASSLTARIRAQGARGLSMTEVVARTGWRGSEITALLPQMPDIVRMGESLVDRLAAEMTRKSLITAVEVFHRQNPLVAGISKEELRGRFPEVQPPVFEQIFQESVREKKLELAGEWVRLPGRSVVMQDDEAESKQIIETAFSTAGLKVPALYEVLAGLKVDKTRAQKIVTLLLRDKVLVKLSDELVFHHTALEDLRRRLQAEKAKSERIDVARFKDLAGVSRKYAIPLLEYLDRERVTRRVGDVRVIL